MNPDGRTEWTDDAKTISLRLCRGIKNHHQIDNPLKILIAMESQPQNPEFRSNPETFHPVH